MADQYEHLRTLPLLAVLNALGFNGPWKPRKNGTEWAGPCAVHQPKKNNSSFSFGADGKFNCFSCSAKGKGAIDLVMAIKRVGFREAVELLEGLNVTRDPLTPSQVPSEESAITENQPFAGTYEKFAVPSAWLDARGLSADVLKRYEVFEYRNDKRRSAYNGSVMLKIRRWSDSECVGYLSRNIGEITPENPKYCFPRGFAKHLELFGAVQIKNGLIAGTSLPLRVGYLVESPFACMKLSQMGKVAVAPFGWTLSPEQVSIMAELARGWICLVDRNKTVEFAPYAHLLSRRCWVKCPELPEGVDDPEALDASQVSRLA